MTVKSNLAAVKKNMKFLKSYFSYLGLKKQYSLRWFLVYSVPYWNVKKGYLKILFGLPCTR
jgi:hypothetical protein